VGHCRFGGNCSLKLSVIVPYWGPGKKSYDLAIRLWQREKDIELLQWAGGYLCTFNNSLPRCFDLGAKRATGDLLAFAVPEALPWEGWSKACLEWADRGPEVFWGAGSTLFLRRTETEGLLSLSDAIPVIDEMYATRALADWGTKVPNGERRENEARGIFVISRELFDSVGRWNPLALFGWQGIEMERRIRGVCGLDARDDRMPQPLWVTWGSKPLMKVDHARNLYKDVLGWKRMKQVVKAAEENPHGVVRALVRANRMPIWSTNVGFEAPEMVV